jgi:hypothetical protein
MKKKFITISIIIMVIFLVFILLTGVKSNTNTSNYSINYTWTDENKKYVSDINFRFNTIKEEEAVANIYLKENSIISVDNYISEVSCIIKIADNNDILNEYTIKQNSKMESVIKKEGNYRLILKFKSGKGEGKISIINN